MSIDINTIAGACSQYGWHVDAAFLETLEDYAELLLQANKQYNLVSASAAANLEEHLVDSLSFLSTGLMEQESLMCDVGSGAGLPGIVLAIVRPQLQVVLVESNGKKAGFLRATADRLGLLNVTVVEMRIEDVSRFEKYREKFDLVTARAVARLNVLLEYGLPLLAPGGRLIAAKGPAAKKEVAGAAVAEHELGGSFERVSQVDHLGGRDRWLVTYRKSHPVPSLYPRRAGVPSKRPLGGRDE